MNCFLKNLRGHLPPQAQLTSLNPQISLDILVLQIRGGRDSTNSCFLNVESKVVMCVWQALWISQGYCEEVIAYISYEFYFYLLISLDGTNYFYYMICSSVNRGNIRSENSWIFVLTSITVVLNPLCALEAEQILIFLFLIQNF